MTSPVLTLEDWEKLYRMIQQKDEQIVHLEGRLARLENRIPDTDLLSKSRITRIITVMGYTFAAGFILYALWFGIWLIMAALSIVAQWPAILFLAVIVVIGIIVRRRLNNYLIPDDHHGVDPFTGWYR